MIFESQPNLVMESRVHSSLHPNFYHQIVFAKFNLKILYPPPYKRESWHYDKINTDLIRRSMNEPFWEKRFFNTDVNQKVYLFNEKV